MRMSIVNKSTSIKLVQRDQNSDSWLSIMLWPKGAIRANIIVFPYQLNCWLLLFCPKRLCQTKTLEMDMCYEWPLTLAL